MVQYYFSHPITELDPEIEDFILGFIPEHQGQEKPSRRFSRKNRKLVADSFLVAKESRGAEKKQRLNSRQSLEPTDRPFSYNGQEFTILFMGPGTG